MAENVAIAEPAAEPSARVNPFANRNFRLLWMGEGVSLLGDQFYVVALPWLVFQLTGSMLAFGTILMMEGIPRAVFMLFGGVFADRFSPRRMMIVTNIARLALTCAVTLLVLTNTVQLWMLYVIALLFGIADAFFQPAAMAMIPMLTDEQGLQASNATWQGTTLAVQSVGPAIAGVIVKVFGMVFSFAFDALTFLFTSVTLSMMRLPKEKNDKPKERRSMIAEIGEAFRFVLDDPLLKPFMGIVLAINFLFAGPMIVGPTALAKDRFAEGSVALGAMLSAFGIGALLGMLAGGTLHPRRLGVVSMSVIGMAGVGVMLVGYAPTLVVACLLMALVGACTGFVNVLLITWLQRQIAKEMMGRMMSLVALAGVGLAPISNAIAGALADHNLLTMFLLAGGLLVLTCLVSLLNPQVRNMREAEATAA